MPFLRFLAKDIHFNQLIQEVTLLAWSHPVHVPVGFAISKPVVDLWKLHTVIQSLVVATIRILGKRLPGFLHCGAGGDGEPVAA